MATGGAIGALQCLFCSRESVCACLYVGLVEYPFLATNALNRIHQLGTKYEQPTALPPPGDVWARLLRLMDGSGGASVRLTLGQLLGRAAGLLLLASDRVAKRAAAVQAAAGPRGAAALRGTVAAVEEAKRRAEGAAAAVRALQEARLAVDEVSAGPA